MMPTPTLGSAMISFISSEVSPALPTASLTQHKTVSSKSPEKISMGDGGLQEGMAIHFSFLQGDP